MKKYILVLLALLLTVPSYAVQVAVNTEDGSVYPVSGTVAGGGSVTSVAMTVPTFLSVSGSPITTSGTLGVTLSGTALPVANGGTAATSAGITAFNNITGYTASGATGTTSTNLVFSTSPTLITPTLGVAVATSINGNAFTTGTYTLTGTAAKTLTFNNSLTLAGTDATTMTFPTTSATVARTDAANTFTGVQTMTSPSFTTPVLGTPTSGTLTNCTFPTLNQNSTGSAASLSVSGQTGLITVTGIASTSRIKTVRDAADTFLELGGSYTPTGTWTNMTLVTPALGTPASGNLTNATALPVSGITASTSTALGVGSIELGHASDTTLARSAAGAVTIEGVVVDTTSNTVTLTNKRVTKRSVSTAGPGATPSINTDTTDVAHFTALAVAITSMTTNLTGTPVEGDTLRIDFTDNATARAITWGASFEASGNVALPITTVLSVRIDCVFVWNTVTSKWHITGVA